jgi:hypothetical protein
MRRGVEERGDSKWLNENLQPLRRYLERQLGRPWNKVNSEMRACIDTGNEVQAHVLTHLEQFLLRKVTMVEPSAKAPCGLLNDFRPVRPGQLYVDPDDGIIKRARRKLRGAPDRPRTDPPWRRMGRDELAVQLGGVWYAVPARGLDLRWAEGLMRCSPRSYGIVYGVRIRTFDDIRQGAEDMLKAQLAAQELEHGRVRRQLSGRELRRLGLENTPV